MGELKVEVRYFSKSGNTKKLAEAIAEAAGCTAYQIPTPVKGETDILFLGAAVYWGGISSEVKKFIQTLDKNRIDRVAVFSTSSLAQRAFPQIRKELEKNGIKVIDEDFYCRGQFKTLYRNRPDENDLKEARKYAGKIIRR
ncbi:MAG: flavodoxin [Lachnospiraceae bacterium]|nr:flavodoxin [Lachnospiraceae bacterium]